MINVRFLALKCLFMMENDGYSNLVINSEIESNDLTVRDAAFLTALVYGVVERKITLDYQVAHFSKIPINKINIQTLNILRLGAYQLLFMDKIPDSAAVNESVLLCKKSKLFSSTGFVNAILRNIAKSSTLILPNQENYSEYISVKYSMPPRVINLLYDSYGEERVQKMLDAFLCESPRYIRVNTLLTTATELKAALLSDGLKAEDTLLENCLKK